MFQLIIFALLPYLTTTEQFNKENIIFHYNNTYEYNVPYRVMVNKSIEYIMEFGGEFQSFDTPARVTVASDFANRTYPLFITARQQKGVFSWQLPMLIQTPTDLEQFNNISRTLCPHNNLFSENEEVCDISSENTPIVQLSSSSPDSIEVTIVVETVEDFYVKLNSPTNLTTTPSQPKYYFYPFKQPDDLHTQALVQKQMCNVDLTGHEETRLRSYKSTLRSNLMTQYGWFSRPKSVIVEIESDDDLCAIVSIQNFACPVFDNERDILYDGYYLTMTRKGGITLTQDTFPVGFYIVFIVKSSDEVCTGTKSGNDSTVPKMAELFGWSPSEKIQAVSNDGRVKTFSFRIVETISYKEYMIGAGAALGFFMSFYFAFVVAVLVQKRKQRNVALREDDVATSVGNEERRRLHVNTVEVDMASTSEQEQQKSVRGDAALESSSNSDTESDISTDNDSNDTDRLIKLCVASLARSRPRVLSKRSKMYLWNVLTVAVFYTLPVIQLVVTYQRLLNQSGNQDLCYFNFLCAHPLVTLSDFNHVFSNLGYVLLGTLFLLQVWRRHIRYRAKTRAQKDLGIPQHFGLLYAMGIALISEGLLSAAYHVCPNSMNFQFDTSFMYVTSVLCMVKIYQARHPDINARAHATFGVLALIIFVGLVGVLNANFYFWIIFTALHLITCFVMTFQIYYLGRFKYSGRVICNAFRKLVSSPLAAVTPTHCGRCVLLLIANLVNWSIAAYGLAQHSRDFASHLLLVLMGNLFIYTLFYIVMKLLHREHIRWYSWVFIVLTYSTWFSSSYFYLDLSTNWALTPAESRRSNTPCLLLQLYDSHDIWHFMSATAMFFSFNMYLTIDDNLHRVPRTEIMVF